MSTSSSLEARIDAFLDSLPAVLDSRTGLVDRGRAYRSALFDAGLAGLDIPVEYGGQGLDTLARATFDARVHGHLPAEADLFTIGLGMAVPTLLEHGTEDLKRTYVERSLRGEFIWCQMYSEPGAGSDLASLQTRAVRDDDGWTITGQKVWTSRAAESDVAILLARTDPDVPKHRGLTMFVLPMHQEGVTVRPIEQITGDREFNEIFLDGARVPADHVVGEVGDGWRVGVSLLSKERQSISSGGGRQPVPMHRLLALVGGSTEAQDPQVRQMLASAWAGRTLAALVNEQQAERTAAGEDIGPEVSLGKLWRTENGRRAREIVSRVAFSDTTAWNPGDERDQWTHAILDSCALSLAGGTDEIQLNILAERFLRMPRDPFTDSTVPFRELRAGTMED